VRLLGWERFYCRWEALATINVLDMKNVMIVMMVVGMACSKHSDPGFTSAAGNWSYTSPDSEVTVTFELVKNASGGFDLQNPGIELNGVKYIAAAQLTRATLTTIQKIQINANDPKATYAYDVEFDNCTVSADFKTITVASGFYTWPNAHTHTLTSAKILRM
jgi:hypothetical protein